MISDELRRELQAIGESEHFLGEGLLGDRDRVWWLLMCGNEPWQELAVRLDERELRNVIRGLVLFSRATGWSGGSVSPVIVLYRSYMSRFRDREPELTEWIVQNRHNDYEPFGTTRHGDARSWPELRAYQAGCAAAAAAGRARDAERERAAAEAKAADATTKVAAAVRRGDVMAVRGLLARGADPHVALPPGGSLMELARMHGRDRMVALLEELGIS